MLDMFGKLNEAKQKMEEAKARLDNIYVDANAGDGAVKIVMTASKQIKDVQIADQLLNPAQKEELQDLIIVAVDRAMEQADNVAQTEMKAVTGDLLPVMGGMFD